MNLANLDLATLDAPELTKTFVHLSPHNKALGMILESLTPPTGLMRLPYKDILVGNPETGVIHGGVITTLIDSISGLVSVMSRPKLIGMATLDLRIDYLKPATPNIDLLAEARVYKETRLFSFVRCVAYHEHLDDPVAHGTGVFMVTGTDPVLNLGEIGVAS